MTIELYKTAAQEGADTVDSPVSNLPGKLPDEEPALDPDDLLGTFDSREEALVFLKNLLAAEQQVILDSRIVPFSQYTHIESLTVTVRDGDAAPQRRQYYLVTDEGY